MILLVPKNCDFKNIFLTLLVFTRVARLGPPIVSHTDDHRLPEAFEQVQTAGKVEGCTSSSLMAGVEARQEVEYKSS